MCIATCSLLECTLTCACVYNNLTTLGTPTDLCQCVLQPGQLQVKEVEWDAECGSNNLDALLAQHFAKEFAAKHSLDAQAVLGNPRTMAKMRKQVCVCVCVHVCAHVRARSVCMLVCIGALYAWPSSEAIPLIVKPTQTCSMRDVHTCAKFAAASGGPLPLCMSAASSCRLLWVAQGTEHRVPRA